MSSTERAARKKLDEVSGPASRARQLEQLPCTFSTVVVVVVDTPSSKYVTRSMIELESFVPTTRNALFSAALHSARWERLGAADGTADGKAVGLSVGGSVGSADGVAVGACVGSPGKGVG